jgi:hypothetical protein
LTFNGLQGVISQKIVLFINTAVRTLNPTSYVLRILELLLNYTLTACHVDYDTNLEFPVIELIAVLKQELVGGSKACFDAVFNHCAGPGGT